MDEKFKREWQELLMPKGHKVTVLILLDHQWSPAFLIMSPNENSDAVGLILGEVVDQFAADLGPQDRRYPPDFWHLVWKYYLL